jgi:hypothetical protein
MELYYELDDGFDSWQGLWFVHEVKVVVDQFGSKLNLLDNLPLRPLL